MCSYGCEPGVFCKHPRSPFDPCPEGVELQRMRPEVERLVIQAEKVGYLNSENRRLEIELGDGRREMARIDGLLQSAENDRRLYKAKAERLEEYSDRLERKVAAQKKKVTKKGKK